ncbi:MAG: peptidase M61 [Microscillaceae bacterium]|nr:peptidase M61 [Microscillaceae bacterium]
MKKTLILLLTLFAWNQATLFAQKNTNKYQYSIDLTATQNDKVTVELIAPLLKGTEAVFHLPKIVPGTYSIHNYGSFASAFQAYDKNNNPIQVEQLDKNSWKIQEIAKLYKITYQIDDSWDTPEIQEDIFEPAGTNIQKDTLFVINTFGFFGYFKGNEKTPCQVRITKPQGIYGSTALSASKKSTPQVDIFETKDYHTLADSPMMYCQADTAWLKIGNTDVLISVFSPNKKADAKLLASDIKPVLEAQKTYLGGKLPVNKYAFLIYLSDWKNISRYGALEHSQSSVYFLPEAMSAEDLSTTMKDVAAHEFFHIVTPLNIHSEEIGNFDYINPKMSKHLWLYEGLTEYAAHHAQLKGKIIDLQTYLDRQAEKVNLALTQFDDQLSFTELSTKTLEEHKEQYQNVYYKGALIGLCLDIKLRQLSGGKYGTQELMRDLAKSYGKYKSFKDEELFDKITALTYPEIREFFRKHVEGSEALPLQELMNVVGIDFNAKGEKKELGLSWNVGMGLVPNTRNLQVVNTDNISELGKRLDLKPGDQILKVNGEDFNLDTYQEVFQKYQSTAKVGVILTLLVKRDDKEIELKSDLQEEIKYYPSFQIQENITAEQAKIRKAWGGE